MTETTQIRKLSLWIFFLPLIAINVCLFISVNYHLFENTIFQVNQIGRSGFTIPYLDGSVSISRASRTFPQYLIFKPSMIITGFLLFYYWNYNNNLICKLRNTHNFKYKFKLFGILSAIFLLLHVIFLGWKFESDFLTKLRRTYVVFFIFFELLAQYFLIRNLFIIKNSLKTYINYKIIYLKLFFVLAICISTFIILLFLIFYDLKSNIDYILEWNYFVVLLIFYLLSFLMWKKNKLAFNPTTT